MVGREAFASDETLDAAAELAATDVMVLNQEACVASRFVFVEANQEDVDRFCERAHARIVAKAAASGDSRPLDLGLREEIDALAMLDDEFRVWGRTDGKGLVIRSDEPVDFHPINKTANVARVDSLDDAMRYVNVATRPSGSTPSKGCPTIVIAWPAVVSSAWSGSARPDPARSAIRTMRCIRCTGSCTGWRTRTACGPGKALPEPETDR